MPWTINDVEKHNKGLSDKQKKKWVSIANSVLKSCQDKGGKGCDAKAIKIANSKVMTNEMITYETTQKEYTVTEATLHGRSYIVVPVTMMVEGVHQGSHGALLHTAEELGKIPESWNGIPVTIGHPTVEGSPVSANSPSVLEEWAVGIVFNTIINDTRLKSEAWLDKEKLQRNVNLSNRIANGEIIEVSVGVFSEDELVENGVWHNESYTAIARNLRPDHLAILPNQTGACSIADGCGIRINSKSMKDEEAVKQLKQQGYIVSELVVNESLLKLVEKVRSFVYQMDNDTTWHYVEDIEDNCVIYSKSGKDIESKLYKQGYAITANDKVTFVGDPVEVVRKVDYETVQTNNAVIKRIRKITNFKKEEVMENEKCTPCIEKKATELITNESTQFTEKDRGWLETLEEIQLDKMIPKEMTPEEKKKIEDGLKAKMKVNATITPEMAINALKDALKGQDDFINLMPTNMQEQTRSALRLFQERKESLIESILTNTEDGTWTKEELGVYEVEKLEKIAKTAGVKQTTSPFNYSGMAAGTSIQDNAKDDVPLMAPVGITFNK